MNANSASAPGIVDADRQPIIERSEMYSGIYGRASIDLETYSSVPIKYGVYPYAESPDAEILLFGYSINDEPVIVIDVANGEKIPDYILKALTDDSVIKWAWEL